MILKWMLVVINNNTRHHLVALLLQFFYSFGSVCCTSLLRHFKLTLLRQCKYFYTRYCDLSHTMYWKCQRAHAGITTRVYWKYSVAPSSIDITPKQQLTYLPFISLIWFEAAVYVYTVLIIWQISILWGSKEKNQKSRFHREKYNKIKCTRGVIWLKGRHEMDLWSLNHLLTYHGPQSAEMHASTISVPCGFFLLCVKRFDCFLGWFCLHVVRGWIIRPPPTQI